ncbi:MAG TPA: hypothetical protein VFZ09_29940 [Archangium sp.]|uniref:hypothetical protein n=1 Tax=Archangium sp. TaxID=1872627 RepID=UPI002E35AE51|nr:hypothetical protein [Archangium sp.]HEX5750487.1 hypothetical protein [Archangium sp.]
MSASRFWSGWGLVVLLSGCGLSGPKPIDLTALEELASFKTSSSPTGSAFDVEVLEDLAFVRDSYGFQVYRLHSGLDAENVASARVEPQSPQGSNHLAVKKGLVALGHGSRVVLFAYEEGTPPRQISAVQVGSTGVGQLVFDGNWLYFANHDTGVRRMDVSDPLAPGFPETVTPVHAQSILLAGGKLYAGGANGLTIVSLEGGLRTLGSVKVPMMSDLVLYEGRWLYGSVGDVGDFAVIDVADPAAPRVVSPGYGSGVNANGMLLHGSQLIVAANNGLLRDHDLSKPEEPVERHYEIPVKRYPTSVTFDMELAGEFLLLAHQQGFFVFRY